MASTVRKGHLSFGLVYTPVRLIRAARADQTPSALSTSDVVQAQDQQAPTVPRHEAQQHTDASQETLAATLTQLPEADAAERVAPLPRVFQSADEDQTIATV
jgi:hypothetical protein